MRSGFGRNAVEDFAHFRGLVFGPFQNGGTATDGSVLFFDFGGAATGYEGAKVGLETAEGDEVCIFLS